MSARLSILAVITALFGSGALLFGCALGHNMKTVETAPPGQVRNTFGVVIWAPPEGSFYSDSASKAEVGETKMVVFGPLYHFRYGITDRIEAGFSTDVLWPGIGAKVRLADWVALDGNVKLKLPIWEDNPPPGLIFDATLIFGSARQSFGIKALSHGLLPGSVDYEKPETVLFYGFRHEFIFPEIVYMTQSGLFGFGLGFVF